MTGSACEAGVGVVGAGEAGTDGGEVGTEVEETRMGDGE